MYDNHMDIHCNVSNICYIKCGSGNVGDWLNLHCNGTCLIEGYNNYNDKNKTKLSNIKINFHTGNVLLAGLLTSYSLEVFVSFCT